jgi:hypothetical protein
LHHPPPPPKKLKAFNVSKRLKDFNINDIKMKAIRFTTAWVKNTLLYW